MSGYSTPPRHHRSSPPGAPRRERTNSFEEYNNTLLVLQPAPLFPAASSAMSGYSTPPRRHRTSSPPGAPKKERTDVFEEYNNILKQALLQLSNDIELSNNKDQVCKCLNFVDDLVAKDIVSDQQLPM
jgi:hypothetical protein